MQRRSKTTLFSLVAVALAVALLQPAVAGPTEADAPEVDPHLARALRSLDPSERLAAFVHLRPDIHEGVLEQDYGLRVVGAFRAVDVFYAVGTVGQFRALTREPSVSYLEANRRLHYLGDTGPWASRARVAQTAVAGGPYSDSSGTLLNGAGIGVAVVDSGINALHPDLQPRVAKNYKIVCSTPGLINVNTGQCFGPILFPEAPHTDISSGHGTHVAGIVAGEGTGSEGTFTGVAPGATLYGYSTGEVISILYAAEAFQHIITNYESFSPRIKVVNNSWGDPSGSPYNPNSVLSMLTKQLIDKGVSVVFAAGNGGGNGSADRLSSTAKDPTPGVITVANYDDEDTGDRNATLDSSSSRGKSGTPTEYPDVSAPGANIVAACVQEAQIVCNLGRNPTLGWRPWYATISGTSMASPHVAGVAAMLFQAHPDLTPAQVEDLLLDTAHKFTAGGAYEPDPQNSGGTTSFDKGAGLVDVPAALRGLGLSGGGTSASAVEVVTGDGGDIPGPGAADLVSLLAVNEANGIRYTIGLQDVDQAPVGITLRVTQNVDGKPFITNLSLNAAGVTPAPAGGSNTAPATEASRDLASNTVSFLVPYSNLGNPPQNAPAHNVFASAFIGAIVDVAPGGPGADVIARPRHGAPFTVRPANQPDPSTSPTPTTSPTSSPTPTTSPSPTSSPSPIPEGDIVFEGEGFIEMSSGPIGITLGDFLINCGEPVTQGLDGYAFELAEEATTGREVVTVTGSGSLIPHDLDLYFYDAGCTSTGEPAATEAPDEIAFVPTGTKWIFAHAFLGLQTTASLKVYTGETQTSPPASPSPEPATTAVSFTGDSARGGKYSDDAFIEARLTDEAGNPIPDATLEFELTGAGGDQEWTADTNDDGVAGQAVRLESMPGVYDLTVRYAPEGDGFAGSVNLMNFFIEKEVTVSTLTIDGKGSRRHLDAALADDDGEALGGETVEFFVDGTSIGTAETDDNGTTTMKLPAKYRNGHHNYEVVFAGDEFYIRSSDRTST